MPRKKKRLEYKERQCEWCEDRFTPKREHGRYCSDECRRDAWHDRTFIRRDKA